MQLFWEFTIDNIQVIYFTVNSYPSVAQKLYDYRTMNLRHNFIFFINIYKKTIM
jgi:hypothetical protein